MAAAAAAVAVVAVVAAQDEIGATTRAVSIPPRQGLSSA